MTELVSQEHDARPTRARDVIKARVVKELPALRNMVVPEGVQPLNVGFFQLEAMRSRTSAKGRRVARAKVRG